MHTHPTRTFRRTVAALLLGLLAAGCSNTRQEAVHRSLDELEAEISADEKADAQAESK